MGHVVGGGVLKVDLAKIEAFLKWPTPTNVTKLRSFVGAIKYLRKFITSF
jgi:hypothetical protein